MKFLCLLVVVAAISSCASKGTRFPSSEQVKPRHIVITLHGVRGNDKSYGDFHQIVKGNLEQIDPHFQVETYNWTYPVGDAVEDKVRNINWGPHEIGNKLNQDFFLGTETQKPLISGLGPQDKISFVAYSMGGLMIMSWYYDTMFNYPNHTYPQYTPSQHEMLLGYLSKVENVIGLGSVFWGSLDAELGWSMLERGNMSEIQKDVPKLQKLCQTPEVKKMTENSGFSLRKIVSLFNSDERPKTDLEKNNAFLENSTTLACEAAAFVTGVGNSSMMADRNILNKSVLQGLKLAMNKVGNVSPLEMNHMRLTGDAINEMRLNRIAHMNIPSLRDRFKTRWTSIVGVFPCLGKEDKGLTCTQFKSENFKRMNEGFVTLFSGVKRRETDGPVASPNAVADFIYFYERAGNEDKDIPFEDFKNTFDSEKEKHVSNQEIFVENMHATVVPALESLTGALKSIGQSGAAAMKKFDASLDTDVVIVNKECGDPTTCKHPNYKHILQTLSKCEAGAEPRGASCDQSLMNQFYHVSNAGDRLRDNEALRQELGSFILNLNIRLPKGYVLSAANKKDIMSAFKFSFVDQGPGPWGENRMDGTSVPYALQIGRPSEFISSYGYLQPYADMDVLRVFLVGRVWDKSTGDLAQAYLQNGVPVQFEVVLPGVKSRKVVAKVKPTYTTYIDMFMK